MTDRAPEKKKSLKDQAQELIQGVVQGAVEALESLMPQPELLPIPVTSQHGRRRRR
jgi:hypothetical protein